MTSRRRRVAVIGGGVTGLGAAWALRDNADVTLYEKSDRIGGHSWTIDIDHGGTAMALDIGFICFNRPNYPNFTQLLKHIHIKTVWTDMAFSVSDPGGYEWSSDPWGLFAWKRNALDKQFRGMLGEIVDFNNAARAELQKQSVPDQTLGDWLDGHGYSQLFRDAYLLPMSAAIWSTPETLMLDYPVISFLQFFDNHRLMHMVRPIWRTVKGGSRQYVNRLLADLGPRVRASSTIQTVQPMGDGRVQVVARNRAEIYDAVIFASHADASRQMLHPSYVEQRLALGSVKFSQNTAYVHHDASLMPERRMAWASWNVKKGEVGPKQDSSVCVTYWMNRLQHLQKSKPVFVTLNPVEMPAADKTFAVHAFDHPMFDTASAAARRAVQRMQGKDGLFFAGAWLGDGFHEAGLRTGLEAAFALGGSVPWQATTTQTHQLKQPHAMAWPAAASLEVAAAG